MSNIGIIAHQDVSSSKRFMKAAAVIKSVIKHIHCNAEKGGHFPVELLVRSFNPKSRSFYIGYELYDAQG